MCILMYYICTRCYCGHPQYTEPCPQIHPSHQHCPMGTRFKFLIVEENACHLHPHHAPLPRPGATRELSVIPGSQPGSWPVIEEVVNQPCFATGNTADGNREAPRASQITFSEMMGSPQPIDARHDHIMGTGQPGGYNNWYGKEDRSMQSCRTNQDPRAHGQHTNENGWNGPFPPQSSINDPRWKRHPHGAAPPPYYPNTSVNGFMGNGFIPPNVTDWGYQRQDSHPGAGYQGPQQMAPRPMYNGQGNGTSDHNAPSSLYPRFPGFQPPHNSNNNNNIGDVNPDQPFGSRIYPGPPPEENPDSGRQQLRKENLEQLHKSNEAAFYNYNQRGSCQSVSGGDEGDGDDDIRSERPLLPIQRRRSKSWSEPYSPHGFRFKACTNAGTDTDSIEKETYRTASSSQQFDAETRELKRLILGAAENDPPNDESKPCDAPTTSREQKVPDGFPKQATGNDLLKVSAKLEAFLDPGQKPDGEGADGTPQRPGWNVPQGPPLPAQKPKPKTTKPPPRTWSAVVAGKYIPSRSSDPFPPRNRNRAPSPAIATGGNTPKSTSDQSVTPPDDVPKPPATTPQLSPEVTDASSTQTPKEPRQFDKEDGNASSMMPSTTGATRNTSQVSMAESLVTVSTAGLNPPVMTPQSSPGWASNASRTVLSSAGATHGSSGSTPQPLIPLVTDSVAKDSSVSTPEKLINLTTDNTPQSTPKQARSNASLTRSPKAPPSTVSDDNPMIDSMIATNGSVRSASDGATSTKSAPIHNTRSTQAASHPTATSAARPRHYTRGPRHTPKVSASGPSKPTSESTAKAGPKRTSKSQRRRTHKSASAELQQPQTKQQQSQAPQRRLWSNLVGGSGSGVTGNKDSVTAPPDAGKDENSWPSLDSAKDIKNKRKWSKPR